MQFMTSPNDRALRSVPVELTDGLGRRDERDGRSRGEVWRADLERPIGLSGERHRALVKGVGDTSNVSESAECQCRPRTRPSLRQVRPRLSCKIQCALGQDLGRDRASLKQLVMVCLGSAAVFLTATAGSYRDEAGLYRALGELGMSRHRLQELNVGRWPNDLILAQSPFQHGQSFRSVLSMNDQFRNLRLALAKAEASWCGH